MRILQRLLLRLILVAGAGFVYLLAADLRLAPKVFRLQGLLAHWQVWLLAAIFLIALRDMVQEQAARLRCRCCGSPEDLTLRGLFVSREVLCKPCLRWDPGVLEPAEQPATKEYAELFEALE
jgi:hypothetical protein